MIILHSIGLLSLSFAIYTFLHVLIGHFFYRKPSLQTSEEKTKPLVLIPAYQPDAGLIERVERMQEFLYQMEIPVVIILQKSSKSMEKALKKLKAYVVHFENGVDVEGNPYHEILNRSMNIVQKYNPSDIVLLDVDNEIDASNFNQLVSYANQFDLVQAKRIPSELSKNGISQFDGISESLNDLMMRASRSQLNFPMEISGSGFICSYPLLKAAISNFDRKSPGMDKNLMIQLLKIKPDISMKYLDDCVVTDEKTEDAEAFGRQRSRWFGNQYYNALSGFSTLTKLAIQNKRWGIFDYLISLCRPPRSFQIVVAAAFSGLEILAFAFTNHLSLYFTMSFIFLASAVFLSIPNGSSLTVNQVGTILKLGLKNLILALKSVHPSKHGTFIHTRKVA